MDSAPRPRPSFDHRTALLAVVLAGAALAGWSFYDARHRDRERAQAEFVRRTSIRHALTREVLGRYEDALFGLSSLFTVDSNVTRPEFLRAARRLEERTPGPLAFEWVPLVTAAERPAFEAALQRSYTKQDFEITELADRGGTVRAGSRLEYLPVAYIQPLDGSEAALGFDLLTGPTRTFLDSARATGHITLTGQVRLVQTPADRPGLVMISPVRRATRPNQPPEAAKFLGYVQAVFLVQDLLERVCAIHPDTALDMLFIDASEPDPAKRVLYFRPADPAAPRTPAPTVEEFSRGLSQELPTPTGGRDWRVIYRPRAGWIEEQFTPLPWVRTGGVLLITTLLAGLIQTYGRRTRQIEHEVAERTAELAESRRELDSILQALPGTAFRCRHDENLTALFVSEGMLALTGWPAADFTAGRRHIPQLTEPADRAAVRAAVAAGLQERRPFEAEYRFQHRDGQVKWVLTRGRPIYDEAGALRFIEGLAIDVTALKHAEQERMAIERRLLEGQKLESLGVMAGGLAHDFNNILTSVLVNASLARPAAGGGPTAGHLEQIEIAARRAGDLCQQLLAYAGKGKLATDRVDLSELVRGSAALLEVTIRKTTRLDLQLADGLPAVLADITQLRQIVMNLVINAADAIGETAGRITVRTLAQEVSADQLRPAIGRPELPGGVYVGLEVKDDGCGMAPETIQRIFEPFFSTKFSGRGLGLAAVQGIVQGHHGALFVESLPGAGSTFRLLLPATEGAAVSSTPPFPVAAAAAPTRLTGCVLVVDDEETVRGIVGDVLEIHGATVLPAASGEEALALLREHGGRISLVLLDLTMPGISGEETLRRFRMLNHRQPVILMSGYSESETMQRAATLGTSGFVQKPFEIATLLALVKPLLP